MPALALTRRAGVAEEAGCEDGDRKQRIVAARAAQEVAGEGYTREASNLWYVDPCARRPPSTGIGR